MHKTEKIIYDIICNSTIPATAMDIKNQTTLSSNTIYRWIKVLCEKGYVDDLEPSGVEDGKSHAVYVKGDVPGLKNEMEQSFVEFDKKKKKRKETEDYN